MSNEVVFPDGLIVKRRDNAPDFVICNLSVKVEELIPFLQANAKEGWVNLDVKRSKAGKLYAALDTWQPTQGQAAKAGIEHAKSQVEEGIADDDVPF